MGWSCSKAASVIHDAWQRACVDQTRNQNTFNTGGNKYFWEASRTEHADGAITGSVFKMISDTHCRLAGTFRIEGNGTITRAPAFLKNSVMKYLR